MNKSKRRQALVNPKTMIITADISKDFHHIYFRSGSGIDSKVFRIENDQEGFRLLVEKMQKFKSEHNLSNVYFGFESTGVYAEPLVHFLSKQDLKMVQVNPRHVKRTKDFSDNSPLKSDKKDPIVIADLIQLGNYLQVIIPNGSFANLRRLSGTRERLVSTRTRLYNILHSQVYLIFPELSKLADIKTKTIQRLLKSFPLPSQIVALDYDSFENKIYKGFRGRLRNGKLRAIYDISCKSVGLSEGSEAICFEVHMLIEQIENLNSLINQIEKKMKEELKNVDYAESLLSLPGIAHVSAAILIGEVGDFKNYRNAKQVEKLAGMNLFENSSGKRYGSHHISKRGRSILRKTYYYIALNSIRKGNIFHNDYKKYKENGKPHYKAIIAIARKLIKLTFAIARDNKRFDEKYFYSNKRSVAA